MKHEKEQLKNKRVNLKRMFYVAMAIATLVIATFQAGVWYARSQAISNPGTTYGPGDVDAYSYIIFKEGSTYYAKNGTTRAIDYSGTDATSVIQTVENVVDDTGGVIYLKGVQLPLAVALSNNVMVIEDYNGKITYYNKLRNYGVEEPYFVADALGLQTNIATPRAYRYSGNYNRTYIPYQSTDEMSPYVTAYDHDKQIWLEPSKVGANPLWADKDTHGAPALIVTNDGYVHVFWGAHGTALKHSRSSTPESISSWTALSDITTDFTYPQLVKTSSGTLYLFGRSGTPANGVWRYLTSTDNGVTWSASNTIIDLSSNGAPYATVSEKGYDAVNGRIYITWNWRKATPVGRFNVYVAYLKLSDGNMYSMDGTNLGTTIDATETDTYCKVVDTGTNWNSHGDIAISPSGIPAVIYMHGYYPDGNVMPVDTKFLKWTGSAWTTPLILPQDTQNKTNGYPTLEWNSATQITAYVVTNTPLSTIASYGWGGDITRLVSTDNGTSFQAYDIILSAGQAGYPLQYGAIVEGGYSNELQLIVGMSYQWFWGAEIVNYELNTKLYAWGNKGFVYRDHYNG